MDYTRTTYVSRIAWLVIFLGALAYEFITLPKGHNDTLSDAVWSHIRFTNWRFAFFPLYSWLAWHWFMRVEKVIDWRDGVAILVGLVWACIDYFFVTK